VAQRKIEAAQAGELRQLIVQQEMEAVLPKQRKLECGGRSRN
jgi:hypothetical protein